MNELTREAGGISAYEFQGAVPEAIKKLGELKDKVPEEFRDSAFISVDMGDAWGSLYCNIIVFYKSPETKEEKEARELEEHNRLSVQTERERRQYEELKKKFEQS